FSVGTPKTQGPLTIRVAAEGGRSEDLATRRSFSLTSHASRAVGARRPVTAPAMERAVPERALRLPLVYDVPCACRRVTLAGTRRSAPVAPGYVSGPPDLLRPLILRTGLP